CAEAEDRLGHRVCVHEVDSDDTWRLYSIGGGLTDGSSRRVGKYLVPAVDDARLPTVFSDANHYRLHYCLMSRGFAPLFPNLTTGQYAQLILTRASREFYGGATFEFTEPSPTAFGFTVENAKNPDELVTIDEVYEVYRGLQDRFPIGELAFLPYGEPQVEAVAKWSDTPFPIAAPVGAAPTYEVYTPGIAYGRVRIVRPGDTTAFGWQDIVVFDDVPLDLEGVMAAAITGARQDILSHLNVLSGQRGTPNFFVDDAIDQLEMFEGQLVRVQAFGAGYLVVPTTEAEAQAHWAETRPHAELERAPDLAFETFDAFDAIPSDTPEGRSDARARFGAKTTGLAVLSQLLDPRYQTTGFGIPFHYYDAFMRDNAWMVDLGQGPVLTSYADTIAAWLDDEAFRTDATIRKARLEQLRAEMTANGVVSPELVVALRARIAEEFGSENVMVRVRSSSNTEDTPQFNGAGLYDSKSACAADSANPDAANSACDEDKDPRTLEAALAAVWASLWNFGAFEERDYYQIDHAMVAMGASVSLQYEGEQANGVAFSGNPRDPRSDQYLINAQHGETDVVGNDSGVTAELSYLTIENGDVVGIDRVVASSLVPAGQVVLSDAQLEELGAVLADLAAVFPFDFQLDDGSTPLLDVEFKITAAGQLVIKQARSFVGTPLLAGPTCEEEP
ncbi:MAG TPA: PEP/pyruvate-binding domain-containing protein, partial [Nannocystaceae bacterium]|nr:PEP/pyruvate-binding domain-containing protein [Nannocystaceae bacterium]